MSRAKLPPGIAWVKWRGLQGNFCVKCPSCKQAALCKYFNGYKCMRCPFVVSARCAVCGVDVSRQRTYCDPCGKEKSRESQRYYYEANSKARERERVRLHAYYLEQKRERAIAKLKLTYRQMFDEVL